MTNQTPVWYPPPKRSFWSSRTPIQRLALIGAALLLPCVGGVSVAAAVSGSPSSTPSAASATATATTATTAADPAADEVTAEPAAEAVGGEPAGSSEAAAAPATATATTATTTAAATVTTKTVTVRKSVAFATKKVADSTLAKGKTKVRTPGVAGVRTLTYRVSLTNGKETGRTLVSDVVTKQPVTKVIAVGTKVSSGGNCDPNYTPCVPIASDVDCAGGSGNGPAYVQGPVTVIGSDIYGLDNDDDGIGCES